MLDMRLDHLSLRSRTGRPRRHRPAHRGTARPGLHRRWRAPTLRHPQHDPAARRRHLPRGRRGARPPGVRQGAVRPGRARPLRRSAAAGSAGSSRSTTSPSVEKRLGREAVAGNRHRPDGTELRWKQIGVNGLIADPQLPFFIEWDEPRRAAPAARRRRDVLPGLPGDRRRPAAGQRVARRDRRGAAGGRQGRVGRPARHARHHRRAVPDPERPGPDLTPGVRAVRRCRPERGRRARTSGTTPRLRAREPRRRPRRRSSRPR